MGGYIYWGPWDVSAKGCAGHWLSVSSELGICGSHPFGVTRGRAMPFRPRPHPRPTDRGRLVTTPLPLHNRRGGGHGREPEGAVAPVPNRAAGTSGLHCISINVYTTVYLGGASESSPWPGVDTGSTPGRAKRHSYALLLARPRARSPRPLCEHPCSFPRLGALRVVFRGVLGPDDRGRTPLRGWCVWPSAPSSWTSGDALHTLG